MLSYALKLLELSKIFYKQELGHFINENSVIIFVLITFFDCLFIISHNAA